MLVARIKTAKCAQISQMLERDLKPSVTSTWEGDSIVHMASATLQEIKAPDRTKASQIMMFANMILCVLQAQ